MKNQILSLNSNYGLFFVILICAVLEITRHLRKTWRLIRNP
jgi:hypothetical protein